MLFQMCNDSCDVVLGVSALERSSIHGTYIHIRLHIYTYVCIRIGQRTCIRGTYMHVYIRINIRKIHAYIHVNIRINIRTIHAYIPEHKTHTIVYTHIHAFRSAHGILRKPTSMRGRFKACHVPLAVCSHYVLACWHHQVWDAYQRGFVCVYLHSQIRTHIHKYKYA